jgi:hypothetical protein
MCAIVMALVAIPARAMADTFDVVTYKAPKGWTVKKDASALTLQVVNEQKKTFSLIIVQPSTASAGSLDKDFKAAWDAQIVPGFKVTAAPEKTAPEKENGWEATSATAEGDANGMPAGVILVVATGHGRTISMIIVTNTTDHQAALEAFVTGLSLDKAPKPLPTKAPDTTTTTTPTAPPATTTKGGPTTKFDDGWTSRVDTDWVEVTKGGHRVRLHYAIEYNDEIRRNVTAYFWNKLIASRYTVTNVVLAEYSAMNFPYYFGQAEAVDNVTKQAGYVSLRIHSAGVAYPIEVFSPSKDAFIKEFPDQDKLLSITGANRFALDQSVAGSWSSFGSASVDMYYAASGNYAGMSTTSIASAFVFNANGTFTSEHKGASSMGGQGRVFQEKDSGSYAVQPWELTTKSKKETITYIGNFSAIRGGFVLNLTNKAAVGIKYNLVRKK